jgi:hypothetical protein
MVQNPNYTRGQGRLVTDRFDFEKHVNGSDFNHKAEHIELSPSITIDGYSRTNVRSAIQALANIAFPPTIVDASASVKGILKLTNDLGGTADLPRVVGLQQFPVSTLAPSYGQVLTWNGSAWAPANNTNTFVAGGDLTGDNISQFVSNISGTFGVANISAPTVRYLNSVSSPTLTQADSTLSSGQNLTIRAQSTTFTDGYGGNLILSGGAKNGTGLKGGVKLQLNNSAADTLLQVIEVASNRRVVGLFKQTINASHVTSGDMVMYIGDTTTPPTSDPVGGVLLYSEAGVAKVRQGSDTIAIGSIPNPSVWGPTGAQVITSQHKFTTTDGTTATANGNGYTLPDNSTTKLDVIVVARCTDSGFTNQAAHFNLSMGYVTVGSTPTDVGTVTISDTRYTSGATAWTATIDRSGNVVRVRVTGAADKTINWFILFQATIGS